MPRFAKVYMKNSGEVQKVYYTNDDKPDINQLIKEKWQSIIDKIADLLSVRASLINKLQEEHIEVFMMSHNDGNPYKIGLCDPVGQGAYCELVMGTRKLLNVKNASKEDIWKESLYVEYNLLSYLGMPIVWPDGEVFGTLCAIDDKENTFDQSIVDMFYEFKLSIEKDLELLMQKHELALMAEFDGLTGVYNRRKVDDILIREFHNCLRHNQTYTITLMDLDAFKMVNDTYGHQMGDQILKTFAKHVDNRIRKTDYFGRLGGDEFILICPHTDTESTINLINSFKKVVIDEVSELIEGFDFSYGIAEFDNDEKHEDMIQRADKALYDMKKQKKGCRV